MIKTHVIKKKKKKSGRLEVKAMSRSGTLKKQKTVVRILSHPGRGISKSFTKATGQKKHEIN